MKRVSTTPLSSVARQEQVRCRAYKLYEQRGREDGHELDDWLQAESAIVPQFTRRKTMAAKFDLKQGGSGQFMFNLKAANGEVILTSDDTRYERKTAKNGQAFFVLTATNGQIIGKSEMYSSVSAMENGIQSVKKNGPVATIQDSTRSLKALLREQKQKPPLQSPRLDVPPGRRLLAILTI
jgi:hypothetical protein